MKVNWPAAAGAAFLGSLIGLSAGRILYEALFPQQLWLGSPLAALIIASLTAGIGLLIWRHLTRVRHIDPWLALTPFLPWLLNLAYLFEATVDLARSRFLFWLALWLSIVFLARLIVNIVMWRWLSFVLLIGFLFPLYLATLGRTVATADAFEFQVVVPKLGIVHPTGYPLYLLLAKLFTLLPVNNIAWRVNLATAVFGLCAVCVLYLLGWRFSGRSVPSLLAAAVFGLTPTFWSQAVEAEVYTLHALIVAVALLLMREIGDWKLTADLWVSKDPRPSEQDSQENKEQAKGLPLNSSATERVGARWIGTRSYILSVALAFTLGLGLTNHLTTVILFPAAMMTLFFAYRAGKFNGLPTNPPLAIAILLGALLLPLLLYAYLPIRWAAVNGEAMGFERFVDWVIGGRFQGALQLDAWLRDPARYDIVGRLFVSEWPSAWTLILIAAGALYALLWQWRYGLLLLLTWLGITYYAISYYVPDLAVFMIPAQLILALWWLVGISATLDILAPLVSARNSVPFASFVTLLAFAPLIMLGATRNLSRVDRSVEDGRLRWGQAVLDLPIEEEAVILADSDKYPSLYYLQQAEGLRVDLTIMVLPDEQAYRSELERQLGDGRSVYLARFLPGLEGIYHLGSLGPLISVRTSPENKLPDEMTPMDISFDSIELIGYRLEMPSPYAEGEGAITLYWRARQTIEEVKHIYMRWNGEQRNSPASGQHPANNTYPTVAWKPGEIVSDFHSFPLPAGNGSFNLQVAVGPPFAQSDVLAWTTIVETDSDFQELPAGASEIRMIVGPAALDGSHYPEQIRPDDDLTVHLSGYADREEELFLALVPAGLEPIAEGTAAEVGWQIAKPGLAPNPNEVRSQSRGRYYVWSAGMETDLPAGDYDLLVAYPDQSSKCGWLSRERNFCDLGQVAVRGIPMPAGLANFNDQVALLSADLPEKSIRPGGRLPVHLTWQSLAPMEDDYTVFVQVLDQEDKIVGQVDSWPVQGTYPTSQWSPGERIEDPYLIQLSDELPPGPYKVYVGLYSLETLRRLSIIDQNGVPVDDKEILPGIRVEENQD